MLFNITFRNPKTGTREVFQIEAETKSAVWPILKERGVNPICVEEAKGKIKSTKMRNANASSNSNGLNLRVLILSAIGILLIGAVCFVLMNGKSSEADKPEKKVVKKEKREVVPTVKTVVSQPKPKEEIKERDIIDPAKAERAAKLKAMTPEERWNFLFEEARNKPLDLTPSTNQVFKTGTEQMMAWIFTTELGGMPPPLPMISIHDEAHMAQILTAKNPALEGDSEKAKEAKAMVELAKKELIKFIKEGGSVDEFFEYYRGELVQAHNEWQDSQKSVMKVIREEPEIAADYIREVNARLNEKGIRSVKIPPKLLEQLGIE